MMFALTLAFAENAKAQTEECPEGETRVTRPDVPSVTGCFADDVVKILNDCEAAGWESREIILADFFLLGTGCPIPSNHVGRRSASQCSTKSVPLCTDIYGDPPVFPKAADHTDVRIGSGKRFVANCNQDGVVPGGYPPNENLNGETECACNPTSHIGEWPDCTDFPSSWTAEVQAMARKCVAQGWTLDSTGGGKCEVPLTSGGNDFDGCFFGAGSPLCADVFGAGFALPEKEVPELVLNLVNTFDAKFSEQLGDVVRAAAPVYAAAVWARHNGEADYADGPINTHNNSSDSDKRNIAVQVAVSVFTAHGIPFNWGLDVSRIPAAIRGAYGMIPVAFPYVFNCGSGSAPETVNLEGATACYPSSGDFEGVSHSALCERFGGRVRWSASGNVCLGLDESGTFCILDSVDAFPCRGLFKRARLCNLGHNRRLLNPFTCGAVCGSGSARGRGCE